MSNMPLAPANRKRAMQIDNTAFGKITIDGKTYEHDSFGSQARS